MKFSARPFFQLIFQRANASLSPNEFIILGIESSCDDTGVGVVSSRGSILADSRHSQLPWHLLTGGVVPSVAGDLHRKHLNDVTNEALYQSNIDIKDIKAIAVTVGPGLPPCLHAGLDFVKQLIKKEQKPVIPIHHMEAHALTARLLYPITFPFLVLLISGGHCILAVCENVGKFFRLGQTLDDSPGEAFDKVSRSLRLHCHPLGAGLPGGGAIEAVAKQGNPSRFPLPHIMARKLDCCFSFAGLKTAMRRIVEQIERTEVTDSTVPLPHCEDIAASFQHAICHHLLTRTERAILYCQRYWPHLSHLVVSGGVASNLYIREKLEDLVLRYNYDLYCPPPNLCTDNGVMIAWAGVEHVNARQPSLINPLSSLNFRQRWPLGEDISNNVNEHKITVKNKHLFKT